MLKAKLRDPSLLVERAYINGTWVDADDGATIAVTNPSDGAEIARVPALQAAETRRAIEAAQDLSPRGAMCPRPSGRACSKAGIA